MTTDVTALQSLEGMENTEVGCGAAGTVTPEPCWPFTCFFSWE